MKGLKRTLVYAILISIPFFFLEVSRAEIVSQKKTDPYEREGCNHCHQGPQKHQIDDSRGPWCANCHKLHNVGTTLGLKTYAKQIVRITEGGLEKDRQQKIVDQEMVFIPSGEFPGEGGA